MRALIYLYDPLCGWCYAATAGIARLRAEGVPVTLRPTGLFSDPGRVMTPEFADYAWRNDQRIAALTGRPFTEAYRRQVLQAPGTAFDSTNAVLALTAVAMDQPDREADSLRAVQDARYVDGRDITDFATLGAILTEAGLARAATAFAARSATLLSANADRLAQGQAMMRELGASGVPTLVLADGQSRRLLDSKVLYGSAAPSTATPPRRADLVAAVFRHEVDACASAAAILTAEHAPAEALDRWMQRYVDFIVVKRGLAAVLYSGAPAFQSLPAYFDTRLEPSLQGLLDGGVAVGESRADADSRDLLRAVVSLCMPSNDGDPAPARRLVALLLDGLRYRARSA